jgi:hypothetical protein
MTLRAQHPSVKKPVEFGAPHGRLIRRCREVDVRTGRFLTRDEHGTNRRAPACRETVAEVGPTFGQSIVDGPVSTMRGWPASRTLSRRRDQSRAISPGLGEHPTNRRCPRTGTLSQKSGPPLRNPSSMARSRRCGGGLRLGRCRDVEIRAEQIPRLTRPNRRAPIPEDCRRVVLASGQCSVAGLGSMLRAELLSRADIEPGRERREVPTVASRTRRTTRPRGRVTPEIGIRTRRRQIDSVRRR